MTKSTFSTLVLLLAIALGTSAAHAAKLMNRDGRAYNIVVVENGNRQSITIGAGQQTSIACRSSCDLYMSGDPQPNEILATDTLKIQQGQIIYQEDIR
ncbi:MAG: hypothetical protein AAFW82_06345 [Pseudomonadota bacterium]